MTVTISELTAATDDDVVFLVQLSHRAVHDGVTAEQGRRLRVVAARLETMILADIRRREPADG